MRFPDFLIIGAMKSGTTTLFRDLQRHPGVFFPDEKEPDDLTSDRVLTRSGQRRYAKLFESSKPSQICGEASTASTKLPQITGVPRRAHQLLGNQLKLIYIVREPLQRTISHHQFSYARGSMPRDLQTAIEEFPELLDYSRYHMQITPWLELFPAKNLRVVVLEEYKQRRNEIVQGLWSFLGQTTVAIDLNDISVENATTSMPVPTGLMGDLVKSKLYRRGIKQLIGRQIRQRLRSRLFSKPKGMPPAPADAVRQQILSDLARDTLKFAIRFQISKATWRL